MDYKRNFNRSSIEAYGYLNISTGYKFGRATAFVNVTNALNKKYKAVGIGMDLNNPNTGLFYGNDQDLVRINGGVRVML